MGRRLAALGDMVQFSQQLLGYVEPTQYGRSVRVPACDIGCEGAEFFRVCPSCLAGNECAYGVGAVKIVDADAARRPVARNIGKTLGFDA